MLKEYIHHNTILRNAVSSRVPHRDRPGPFPSPKKGPEGSLDISYNRPHARYFHTGVLSRGMARLFANGSQGVLTGEHHRGTARAQPGIVVGSFGADDATNGHEQTTAEIGQHGMADKTQEKDTYPKVAPDPSMYLPRVRMTPFGPAPYWKIVTVPVIYERHCPAETRTSY